LIMTVDGEPVPKLIDFGIVKILDDSAIEGERVTRTGTVLGTPEYMSPEQALGRSAEVDTRTDVYALGVVLFELLTGHLPINPRNLQTTVSGLIEYLSKLANAPIPAPSSSLSLSDLKNPMEIAHERSTQPDRLRRLLQGELDAITLKALAKDPALRYATVLAFHDDLERYLTGQPVLARQPSRGYRLRKWMARNRTATLAAAVMALGILGTLVSLGVAVNASRQREAAAEAAVATERALRQETQDISNSQAALNTFLLDLLKSPDLLVQASLLGRSSTDLRVRDMIDHAANTCGATFANDPTALANMRYVLANSYMAMDQSRKARALYELADPILTQGKPLRELTEAQLKFRIDYGWSLSRTGDVAPALAILQEGLELLEKQPEPDRQAINILLCNLANIYLTEFRAAECEAILERLLPQIQKAKNVGQFYQLTATLGMLVNLYLQRGEYTKAEPMTLELLRFFEAEPRFQETNIRVQALGYRASVCNALGRFAEAEKLYQEILPLTEKIHGPESQQSLQMLGGMVSFYNNQKKYPEAMKLAREVARRNEKSLGTTNTQTHVALLNCGTMELLAQDGAAALATHDKLLGLIDSKSIFMPYVLMGRGRARTLLNQLPTGETDLRQAQTSFARQSAKGYRTAHATVFLAENLAAQKKTPEAVVLVTEALAMYQPQFAKISLADQDVAIRATHLAERLAREQNDPAREAAAQKQRTAWSTPKRP
ncbi:MAG: tetratricopeptide repeat protein, partial [Gemmataceae bacterium]